MNLTAEDARRIEAQLRTLGVAAPAPAKRSWREAFRETLLGEILFGDWDYVRDFDMIARSERRARFTRPALLAGFGAAGVAVALKMSYDVVGPHLAETLASQQFASAVEPASAGGPEAARSLSQTAAEIAFVGTTAVVGAQMAIDNVSRLFGGRPQ